MKVVFGIMIGFLLTYLISCVVLYLELDKQQKLIEESMKVVISKNENTTERK